MHKKQEWDDAFEAARMYEFCETDVPEQAGTLATVFVEPYEEKFEKDEFAMVAAIDAAEQQFGGEWTIEQMKAVLASYLGLDWTLQPNDGSVVFVKNDEIDQTFPFTRVDASRCALCAKSEALREGGAAPVCYACAPQVATDFRDALNERGLFSLAKFGPGFDATILFLASNGSKFTATNVHGMNKGWWLVTSEDGFDWFGAFFAPSLDEHLAAHAKLVGRVKQIQL